MQDYQDEILPYLETDFERELFEAAIYNLNETENKLRFNNFAYSMRELTRHFLDRLAPENEIKSTAWYKPEKNLKNKEIITREQRIKFAIQGWFTDDFFKETLKIDYTDISKDLRKSIIELSNYTHIETSTFNIPNANVETLAEQVLNSTLEFFKVVDKSVTIVTKSIYNCVDESIENDLTYGINNELDCLSTHYRVLFKTIDDINLFTRDTNNVILQILGTVEVYLQYGSAGDLRRDDGYETRMSFPYEAKVTISYNNTKYEIEATNCELEVNTESFYQ